MEMRQFVTFRIDSDLFAVEVLKVREINRVLDITPVPHAPDYVRGLVNLRGKTVTIIDLGVRLGRPPRFITEESHSVVIKHEPVALLVDSIGDLVQCYEEEVDYPPANSGDAEGRFVEGVVKLKEELLVILDIDRILE